MTEAVPVIFKVEEVACGEFIIKLEPVGEHLAAPREGVAGLRSTRWNDFQ